MSEASSSPEQPGQEPPKRGEPPTLARQEEGTRPMPPQVGHWSDQQEHSPSSPQPKTEQHGGKRFQEMPPDAVLGVPRPVGPQVLPDAQSPDWKEVDRLRTIYRPRLIDKAYDRLLFLRRIARKLHLR